MYYLLEYITLQTRETFFENQKDVKTITCKKYSKDLGDLIKYMLINDLSAGFFILEEEEFLKQHPKLQCGIPAERHISLQKKDEKYYIDGIDDYNCMSRGSKYYIEMYNKYIDMDKYELYKLYKNRGGDKIFYASRTTMASYLIKFIE